jgi:hypothetical protein
MANQQQGTTSSSSASQSNQTSSNAATAAALASLLPQSTNLHQLTAALVQNSNNLKMEYNNKHDDEPTDLTTSSSAMERKYIKTEAADCYP